MQSFIELLDNQFEKSANNPAIIYHDKITTFAQLKKEVEKVGVFLQEQGLKKGDRVALYTAEKYPFLIIHLGIIFSGGVSLPLNFNFTKEEMIYFLNDSGARFVFASQREASLIEEIKNKCPKLEKIVKHGKTVGIDTDKKFKEVEIEAEDHCFMLYSSGTTGQPKGIIHTHQNVAASLLDLQKCWKFTPEDIVLNVLPLYHIHGLGFATHLGLITGSSIMLEDTFLHTIDKLKNATVFMAIPTVYYALLRRKEFKENAKQWHKTRLFTCGSAPIRPEVLPEFEAIIGKSLINRYGMTEAHVITSLPLDGPFKQGSVGLPLDGIEMKLVSEDAKIIPPGAKGQDSSLIAGEIAIRSKNLFSHYWNKPAMTKAAFDKEGFFLTGDIGYCDEDGFLTLLGRKDDLIIVDGENVYPLAIENVLNESEQVKESAVIGIPDRKRGERIIAIIVPNGTLNKQELKRYCQEKLVNYQQPARFEFMKELPRNIMGKVLKQELKKKFI